MPKISQLVPRSATISNIPSTWPTGGKLSKNIHDSITNDAKTQYIEKRTILLFVLLLSIIIPGIANPDNCDASG